MRLRRNENPARLGRKFLNLFSPKYQGKPVSSRIILFTRYPVPGKCKTRIAAELGDENAAETQRALTECICGTLRSFRANTCCTAEIAYAGASESLFRHWLGAGFQYREQADGTLGDRLASAAERAFEEGAGDVVILGADCPYIRQEHLAAALNGLEVADIVFGPADDGGYYLVALRNSARPHLRALFPADFPWGTDSVLDRSCARAEDAGLQAGFIARLPDVDYSDDVRRWQETGGFTLVPAQPKISVVIPSKNETDAIACCLLSVQTGRNIEVIVADAGSTDGTAALVASLGVNVLDCGGAKAAQMNAAASRCDGEILLFLHADTILSPGWDREVRRVLADTGTALGAFSFCTDWDTPGMRILCGLVNLRGRVFKMPYGDQGLFLRRADFQKIGAFKTMPIMEDLALVRAARKLGKIQLAALGAETSARRWRRLGLVRTTAVNLACLIGYHAGVSPERLHRWYRSS